MTDWSPLTIWFYEECYIRFSAEEYDTSNLYNKFAHLTNNSIVKHSSHFAEEIDGNMWSQDQFIQHLHQQHNSQDSFVKKIQPMMKQAVMWSLMSVQDMIKGRKNSFELYGFDFLVDDNFKPWLLEVNSSPAMEYSTAVTERLVKMVLEDVVKVIIDYGLATSKKKKNIDTGLFKCICRGKSLI